MKDKIKNILKKVKSSILNVWFSIFSIFSKKKEDEGFVLGPVKDFIEGFLGVPITSFNSFHEDIEDIEGEVSSKMIVKIEVIDEELWLELSSINSKPAGYLKLSPGINGQFSERVIVDEPYWSSRYRINFYGGESLEYIDPDEKGTIHFCENFKG